MCRAVPLAIPFADSTTRLEAKKGPATTQNEWKERERNVVTAWTQSVTDETRQ